MQYNCYLLLGHDAVEQYCNCKRQENYKTKYFKIHKNSN